MNPGIDDEYWDLFTYVFKLDLKDADTSKPLSVRLQYGDRNGSGWTDLPAEGDTVNTLNYSGSETTWEGELTYDIFPMPIPEGTGILRQIRIVCDYTLTDGTAGSVYSTAVRELYAYKGDYLRGVSAELKDGVLTASYQVNMDLVMDAGKLSVYELRLWSGNGYGDDWDLEGKADVDISPDGTVNVSYTLDGEEIDPAEENSLGLALSYDDKDGAIDRWVSYDRTYFDVVTHNAPTASLTDVEGPTQEMLLFPYLTFTMDLNDLKGGSAIGTVYLDEGSGFVAIPDPPGTEQIKYDPSVVTGDTWEDSTSVYIDAPEGGGRAGRAKIVFDIVYPDGTTGTVETNSMLVHTGSFYTIDEHYETNGWKTGERTDPVTGETEYTITFDVIIDETLVTPSLVTTEGGELWLEDPSTYYYNAETELYTGTDGHPHIRYTYVSENPFPDGEYWFEPAAGYPEEDYSYWHPFDVYYYFIKSGDTTIRDPAFTALGQQHPQPTAAQDNFTYTFTIRLNDADTTKPVTAQLWGYDPNNGIFRFSDYELTYSGSDEDWSGQFVFDILSEDIGSAKGVLWEIYIYCNYTLTNGMERSISSQTLGSLYAYKGNYLSVESAKRSGNRLTAAYRIDESMLNYMPKETVTPVKLILRSGSSSWDITGAAEFAYADDDWLINVNYTLTAEQAAAAGDYVLELTTNCQDESGRLDWNSSAEAVISASTAAVDPTVSLDRIWYWGEFNSTYGARHVEVAYTIDPQDADPGSITSNVTVRSELEQTNAISRNGISGDGAVYANMNTGGVISFNSADNWETEIVLNYTVGGEAKTLTESFPAQKPDRAFSLYGRSDTSESFDESKMFVIQETDDRQNYSVSFDKVTVMWFSQDGSNYSMVGEDVLWDRELNDPALLSGPDGPYTDGDEKYTVYTLQHADLRTLRPAEADVFMIAFHGSGNATDPFDGTVYPIYGGLEIMGDFKSIE